MNFKNSPSVVIAATLLCVAAYVSAQMQLDTRSYRAAYYNPRLDNNQGHAIDRNPQLGSGGRNSGGKYVTYTQDPNSFTDIGRTRGLTAFQGNTATISDTFNNTSQTTGMRRFEQQAVSVADVVGNPNSIYNPQTAAAYYGQGETVMTAGQAVRFNELNVAPIRGNSNVVADIQQQNQANLLSSTNDLSRRQMNQLNSMLYLQDTPYGYMAATSAPGTLPKPTSTQDVLQLQQALDRLGYAQGAFGVTNPNDRTVLANEINQFDQEEAQTDQRTGMIDARIDNGPITTGNPVASIDASPITGRPAVRDDFIYQQDIIKEKTDTPADGTAPLPAEDKTGFNQDAFHDMVVALQQKATDERNAKELQRKKEQEKEASELEKVIDKEYEKTAEEDELNDLSLKRDKELRKQMLVELNTKHDVVLKNLAGRGKDLFNRYMNNAKNALAKGRYYAASQQYELAAMSSAKNPLPWLGGSLAKFAACEWSVAGFRLKTALEMYPNLMDVKLDLKTLLPDLDIAQQLNLLENWIMAIEPQPNVLLLAAYMQYQVGNLEGARRHAQAILKYPEKISPRITEVAEEILKKTDSKKGK